MNDIFGRGFYAAIVGLIAINIAELIMSALHISSTTLWQAGGSLFLTEKTLNTPLGITIGVTSHILMGLFVGVAISYYIYFTGTNYGVLKGTGVSLLMVFIVLGLIFPLRGINLDMQNNPADVTSAFIDHLIFGVSVSYIISFYQDKYEN